MSKLYEEARKYIDLDHYDKALPLLEKGDQEGDVYCTFGLAQSYHNGWAVEKDESRAKEMFARVFPVLKEMAEQGDGLAQDRIGLAYNLGYGVEVDKDAAFAWIKKAAEQGAVRAQVNLAVCYINGNGVEQSYEKAVEWYEKAAEQGDDAAQNNLGVCYEFGNGVEKSLEKAVEWYTKAAEQGDKYAQCNLGFCYEKGNGVEQSYEKAVEWYEKAAEQGHARAQFNLGNCYSNGEGVEQSYEKAVEWYEKAAEQGNKYAQNNLGWCYQKGEGVEKSYEKAAEWYQKASEQGNAAAQNNLGALYYKGEGVAQSYESAIEWFLKATDNEDPDREAFYYLGDCYHNGYGVEQDIQKAIECYQKAIELGYNCRYALEMAKSDAGEYSDKSSEMRNYAKKVVAKKVHGAKRLARIEKDLQEEFGETWDMLQENAQKALVSGVFSYINFFELGKDNYQHMDFTPSITAMAKALEITLTRFFYKGYLRYVKEQGIPETAFDAKSSLLEVERSEDGLEISRKYRKVTDTRAFSLGSFYHVIDSKIVNVGAQEACVEIVDIERDDKGRSVASRRKEVRTRVGETCEVRVEERRTICRYMADFAERLFGADAFSKANREKEIVNYLIDLASDVYVISKNRNPAAHADTMTCRQAEVCGNYLIKVQKMIRALLEKIDKDYFATLPEAEAKEKAEEEAAKAAKKAKQK